MINVKEKIETFKDKNILVVGLARSGVGAANLLSKLGAHVSVTDRKTGSVLQDNVEKLVPGIDVIAGDNPQELFDEADMIVISPGVPLSIGPLQHAKAGGVPIIGELELAYQTVAGSKLRISGDESEKKPAARSTEPATPHFIGVTGTNGKSTVTTLVDLMLKESGFKTILGGNIGNALTEEILKAVSGEMPEADRFALNADYIVAEISSFQLETIMEFRPKVAAILNISPDHLDRYESMNDYVTAKARILENQMPDDYLVVNADDPAVMDIVNVQVHAGDMSGPRLLYFSREREVEGIYYKEGALYCNIPYLEPAVPNLPFISSEEIRIKGMHNLENAMAAALMAVVSGCPLKVAADVLRNFAGLEHRLEPVALINGVTFINDSKGTNAGAVLKSLESFKDIVLIMGGLDKESDFSILRESVKKNVKHLILLGAAKEKIATLLGESAETHMVGSMHEAVSLSAVVSSDGDTVLLSPGCASFDMFKDFEDRGVKFKEAVRELSEK